MKKHLVTAAAMVFASWFAASASASPVYSIDVNSGASPTAAGWTGLDTSAGTGNGSTASVGGTMFMTDFTVFSSDGHRDRGAPNDLTRDFIFDDGGGQAVGLRVFDLPVIGPGKWQAEVWSWDQTAPAGNQIVGITQLGGTTALDGTPIPNTEIIYTNTFAPSPTDPFTFTFTTSQVADGFGIFTRESNVGGNNRARFNALRLTLITPEPSTFILATLSLLSLGMTRRRRRR